MKRFRWSTLLMAMMIAAGSFAEDASAAKKLPWLGMGFRWSDDGHGRKVQVVERVTPSGPAAQAGLRPGDLILTVGDHPVGFGDDLEYLLYLSERVPGERLILGTVREGKAVQVVVTIGVMPEAARPSWERALEVARRKRRQAAAAREQ